MKILKERCIGCGRCLVFCPMQAIKIQEDKAIIDTKKCIECGVCHRASKCPVDAFYQDELKWPRSIRKTLSDPLTEFKATGVAGRGTEEMKTNDVTERFKWGEVGFAIDVGRPNTGTTLIEIKKITEVLAQLGVDFEKNNPITFLMKDTKIGTIKEDVRNELVMSGIIEFKVPTKKMLQVLDIIKQVSKKINTVFTIGIITRVNDNWNIPIIDELIEAGWKVHPNGKTNLGFGRR
ncbi:Ion-translocating oxidoreductase complex subunit B [subsurface metagenome]|nr:4Fe-4S dicluster domain-containing protein [Clostridia bacterium]